MSAVLKRPSAIDQHTTLLGYEAKGLFFLRMALREHTDSPNLLEIAQRATEMYNGTINERAACYQPFFRFHVLDDSHLELRMYREGVGAEEDQLKGTIKLALHQRTQYESIIILDPSECEPQQDELFH